jgi:hypothetical protein
MQVAKMIPQIAAKIASKISGQGTWSLVFWVKLLIGDCLLHNGSHDRQARICGFAEDLQLIRSTRVMQSIV